MMLHPASRFDDVCQSGVDAAATQQPYGAPVATEPFQHRFSPYVNNGGTVIGVAGDDFAVCVADTRLSMGFRIHTRNNSKFVKLTDKVVLASSGMQADILALHKTLLFEIRMYEHAHRSSPSIEAIAQLLSTRLYGKRFFPFYAFNALIGLDKNGRGAIYDYDAIGSFERSPYTVRGSGNLLAISILDTQIKAANQIGGRQIPLSKLETIDLAKDVITSVAERDICTGDSVDVVVIDASGVSVSKMELRKD